MSYPRRVLLRSSLRLLAKVVIGSLTRYELHGRENLPRTGPLLVVANHFHFGDPAVLMRSVPWPIEFLGATQFIDPPFYLKFLPHVWGYYNVHRGGASREGLRAAETVLAEDGILAVFPEAGSWAAVLRPARPGTALLAVQTGAPLLPIGLDGVHNIFPALRQRRRATVTVRIGRPFGPYTATGRGRARRAQLETIGEDIMRHIADLIPPERHGVFAADPALREAAQAVAAFPYGDLNG